MKNIFEKDLSGEMVSPNEPGYEALISDIFATIKTATEMNTGYRTSEEVREYMKQILGKPLRKSTTVLPPLYIDYGQTYHYWTKGVHSAMLLLFRSWRYYNR